MNLFATTPSQRQLGIGLLILRLALAAVFIVHGGQKLFEMGPSGTAEMLTKMGVPGRRRRFARVSHPTVGACYRD